MEMNALRYFLAVSETMNFTQAAQKCGVRQPSLTRAVGKLEEDLGGELIHRERAYTHLTELGRSMLPLLRKCHDSAMDAKALALENSREPPPATLTLALSHTISMQLLSGHLQTLIRSFPQLEFDYFTGTAAQVIEALENGTADLAIAGPLGEVREDLDSWTLFDEDFALAISKSNICSDLQAIKLSRLHDIVLMARPYCENHADLSDLLDKAGIAIDKALHIWRDADLIALIRADLGACIIPRSVATGYGFRMIAIEDFELRRSVSLYSVAGRQRTAAAGVLAGQLLAHDWLSVLPGRDPVKPTDSLGNPAIQQVPAQSISAGAKPSFNAASH